MANKQRPATKQEAETSQYAVGSLVIASCARNLPAAPGIYRMIDAEGSVLYVGKAKDLRIRVASYAKPSRLSARIGRMAAQTASVEFVTTNSEAEALLLEANLIKSLAPRYNILLRDDKTLPSILVASDHAFARILKHRGPSSAKGDYYGPFASAGAVNETVSVLQRAFLLRTCSDAQFAQRKRPCLLYQVKRCSAPCAGRISKASYAELVDEAKQFLGGKSNQIQQRLAMRMQQASDAMEFEKAALCRDRIRALASIQADQDINIKGIGETDVIAIHQQGGQSCIQVFFFRGGRNFGGRAYFPSHAKDHETEQVLAAFIAQFYDAKPPPPLILTNRQPAAKALLARALSFRAQRLVSILTPKRGKKQKIVEHALVNARQALAHRLNESASQRRQLEGLAAILGLDAPPKRIEVYDNSHLAATSAAGAMIVAGLDGFVRKAYRKFNISGGGVAGDDYAMMRQVLTRRFASALKQDSEQSHDQWPDLVIIDGGAMHLKAALEVFSELGVVDVAVIAIAKGPKRNAGRERLYIPLADGPLVLDAKDPTLYFLQRLRDEAHRFAIGAHRDKRAKAMTHSALNDAPGVGPKRKKALLLHFGSFTAIASAGRKDLAEVEGISQKTANKIHDWLHSGR